MLFRLQGVVQNPIGQAIPGASVAVLTQPASFATQPGSPLATIYEAPNSNSATITALPSTSSAALTISLTLSLAGGKITYSCFPV